MNEQQPAITADDLERIQAAFQAVADTAGETADNIVRAMTEVGTIAAQVWYEVAAELQQSEEWRRLYLAHQLQRRHVPPDLALWLALRWPRHRLPSLPAGGKHGGMV